MPGRKVIWLVLVRKKKPDRERSHHEASNASGLRDVLEIGNLGLNLSSAIVLNASYSASLCFNFLIFEMVMMALSHSTDVDECLVYSRCSSRCCEWGGAVVSKTFTVTVLGEFTS